MINNTTTTEISFWNFINEYKIEIPIIQRDYAQGRLGKENMRKNFLGDMKKALDSGQKMKLDFVYGSAEQKKLNPLDGQQRLTTLWLLHWYIALRAGKINEVSETLKKFSYETRISSREFCKELCKDQFVGFDGNDIVKFITKQTWFYSAWKQDPTIQSMLRMLGGTKITDKNGDDITDGIEELFKDCCSFDDYWERLTTKNIIVFYHLPLDDFGLSDDLYIKMNARGKQLTNFENFKADLIGYISNQYDLENDKNRKNEWGGLLDSTEGIPIKFDTTWTNIFWNNRSDNKIDEIYFAFLNRFFLSELICQKNGQNYLYTAESIESHNLFNLLYGNKGDDKGVIYSGLEVYKYYYKEIPIKIFQSLKNIFDNYSKNENINEYFPNWTQKGFQFIPKYQDDVTITTLGQKERVVFVAVARYFEIGNFEEESFKQWMRVVWNIVENAGIDTISAMIGAIRLIDELSEHSHDIYSYLKDNPKIKSGTAEAQVAEEIAKAKQIIDENGTHRKYNGSCKKENGLNYETWEEIIIEAESYAFFKGAIRFLFQDAEGKVTEDSWKNFDTKWENAQKYFDNKASTISLAEYCTDEQTKNIWSKFSFEYKNWKSLLLQDDICEPIHKFLLKSDKPNPTVLLNDLRLLLPELKKEKDGDQDSYVWLLKDWASCNVVLTNYSVRKREPYNGWVLEVGNNIRNNWNSIIANNDSIIKTIPDAWGNESYNINGKIYYRGLWTNFIYNGNFFTYYGNNTICLMNDNWNGKKLRVESEQDKPENNFWFQVSEQETSQSLLKQLDYLIQTSINGSNVLTSTDSTE